MSALDQIVAEKPLLRKTAAQQLIEDARIVDPLPVVGGLASQIHIGIRYRSGVRVNTNGVGEETAEGRLGRTGQRCAHSRLNDCVGPFCDLTLLG